MGIKFDKESRDKSLNRLLPELFPDVWDKWQAPEDELISGIESEIKSIYSTRGKTGLQEFIHQREKNIKRVQERTERNYSHDDEFELYCATLYFNRSIQEAENLLKEIDESDHKNERLKYHSGNYWDTAHELYDSDTAKTWKMVYDIINEKESELVLPHKYNSFESFTTRRKQVGR